MGKGLFFSVTVAAEQGQGCEMRGSGEICFLCSFLLVSYFCVNFFEEWICMCPV